jgi:hypothetical protein
MGRRPKGSRPISQIKIVVGESEAMFQLRDETLIDRKKCMKVAQAFHDLAKAYFHNQDNDYIPEYGHNDTTLAPLHAQPTRYLEPQTPSAANLIAPFVNIEVQSPKPIDLARSSDRDDVLVYGVPLLRPTAGHGGENPSACRGILLPEILRPDDGECTRATPEEYGGWSFYSNVWTS